jgi:CDP-diacylglycerol--glycerol-3-phosphate 3-phosphatidyltransferase
MNSLYALKPWYAARLTRPRTWLVRHDVSPTTLSWTGVGCAGVAAATLATAPTGAAAAAVVGAALAARLACANLDGGVARAAGRTTAWGAVTGELTDRLADLVVVAALLAHAPVAWVAAAALGASAPSWVALAGVAAGADRRQDGPLGKTERAALAIAVAGLGHAALGCAVLAAGGVVTAAVRLVAIRRQVGGVR